MIRAMKARKEPISITILEEPIRAIIRVSSYAHLLVERGGAFKVSSSWIRNLLHGMGMTARTATQAPQKVPADWPHKVDLFIKQNAYLIAKYKIPSALVWNFDQSAGECVRVLPVVAVPLLPTGAGKCWMGAVKVPYNLR